MIVAAADGISGTTSIVVSNAAPTVATPASTPSAHISTTATTLAVLGEDDGGESALTYAWSVTTSPAGASPIFSANDGNAAKNVGVTFDRAGSYTFSVTISDGTLAISDSISLVVDQTLTAVVVSPGKSALNLNESTPLAAAGFDQFGAALAVQPAFSWTVSSGVGIVAGNNYNAGAIAGAGVVQASSGGIHGSASISVSNAAPTVALPASALESDISGTGTTLSVLGADDGGENGLTYTWSITASPGGSAPVFSINGSNAAKSVGVTFDRAGTYLFSVNISDGLYRVSSSVNVVVDQTLSSITVVPGVSALNFNQTTPLSASAFDQFGAAIAAPPTFTWSDQGVGTVGSSAFNAGSSAGTATIQAASGNVSGSAAITVTNAAPSVATAASAGALNVVGTSTSLSALGADDGGEAGLTYTWSATTKPTGANPSFSVNGNNSAKNAAVTFDKAGAYAFLVTISDGSLSVSSSVNLVVSQTLSSIIVTAGSIALNLNQSTGLSATGFDQFNAALVSQPTFTWSKTSGVGTVTGSSFASGAAGNATVAATSGAISGSLNITVTNAAPTLATAAAAGTNAVTGTTTTLSALGADDGGEAGLTYTWSATAEPTGALPNFSANGTNLAKNATVTFDRSGAYTFLVTISDGTLAVTSCR